MTQVLGPDTAIGPLVRSLQAEGVDVHVVPAGADKAESLRIFGQVLDFPDWYGHNLDALYDCLLELVLASDVPVHVVWDGTAPLRASHPDVVDAVVRLLDDAEQEQETFTATVVDR
jgi:RNAse (barnase) inhibitor barstar